MPDIEWDIPAVKKGTKNKTLQQELLNTTTQHSLVQIQDKPTRENSILDLYFTDNPSLIKYSEVVPGISDHEMVVVDQDLHAVYNKHKSRKIYKYKKADWDGIRERAKDLSRTILQDENKPVNDRWVTLKNGILKIMDDLIPAKWSSARFNLPWLTRTLRRNIKKKHTLLKKAKSTKNKKVWDKYKKHKRETQRAMREAQLNYVNNILQDSLDNKDPKPFWKYVKSKKRDNIGISPIKDQGKLYSHSKEKAELLSKQFQSVFTKEGDETIPSFHTQPYPSVPDIIITEQGVNKLLKAIKVNKAAGPDCIPNRMLKETSDEISPALASIFQQSLNTGELPDDWTKANIAPIFKKGSRQVAANYRPVSLTCVCCKILEHIVCKHILDHMELYDILTILQHGFRLGHSCETQLLITLHDILSSYDQKHQVDLAILDFSKAFDTVPHNRLLYKLSHYGITGNTLNWIQAFLTNRSQTVVVEGETSEDVRVESGVPQGTVLGPLLFLIFINDLPQNVQSQVRLFADDCLLYRPIKSMEDQQQLQEDLTSLESWATLWGMKFNPSKCYIMRISRSKQPMEHYYTLNDHVLEQVSENPYLGVLISEDLKWTKHINKTCKRATSVLSFLRRNLKGCPTDLKLTAYKSLIRSTLEYASTVWDPHLVKDTKALEAVQRKSARFIMNDYTRDSSVTTMLHSLDLPSLADRRKDARLIMLYKIINDLIAIKPTEYLIPNTRQTRSTHGYIQQRCNTTALQHSFFPRTVKDWNAIPSETKIATDIETFKSRLK